MKWLLFPLAALTIFSIPTRADTIATIDVSASFIPPSSDTPVRDFFQAPDLFVIGQIFFDMTKGISKISDSTPPMDNPVMNFSLFSSTGQSAQFSTQGTGYCYFLGIGDGFPGTCNFYAQVGNASVAFQTLFVGPSLSVGQSFGACAVRDTFYVDLGIHEMGGGPCGATSHATLGDTSGDVYTLLDNSSSGRLTVTAINEVNVPEPNSLCLLTAGLLMTAGLALKKAQLLNQ